MAESAASAEFALIARHFNQPALAFSTPRVEQGIGDDCALLSLEPGCELAVSMDLLQPDVHYPAVADPVLIGQRALLVNLSDLAAMGAEPVGFTLGLSLSAVDENWVQKFAEGLAVVAQANACPLIGGDTTRGQNGISIQVHGSVPRGQALRRSGAQIGDIVCVTGTLGDAAAGLAVIQHRLAEGITLSAEHEQSLLAAFYQPASRIRAGLALRGRATSAIDVSDGLAADLGHILQASGCGATLMLDSLPASAAFQAAVLPAARQELQLGGGDDYELCFTLPEAELDECRQALMQIGVTLSQIGIIEQDMGLRCVDDQGRLQTTGIRGYQHFE